MRIDIDGKEGSETLTLVDGTYEGYEDKDGNTYKVLIDEGEIFLVDIHDNKEQIGKVNTYYNGKGERALQIDFSTPLENGDFEEVGTILWDRNVGTISGWTIRKSNGVSEYPNQVFLGELASKTQAKPITTTTSVNENGNYVITGQENAYSYETDVFYNPNDKTYGNGWKTEGKEKKFSFPPSASNYITKIGSDYDDTLLYDVDNAEISRGNVLKLGYKGGSVEGSTRTAPYGTVFGPEAISDPFSASPPAIKSPSTGEHL